MSSIREENKRNEYDDILYIQTLGDFTLKYKGNLLSGEKVRSKQVWSLLEYIITNRYKDNSLDKLIDVLWYEDEIDDPANALKNLAYRLRTVLKEKLGIKPSDYILTKHGSYSWNTEANCIIDSDVLEELVKNTNRNYMNEDDVCHRYLQAIDIYNGGFMPQACYKEWVRPLAVYYQNLYMEAVEKVSEILLNRFDYLRVEEICIKAISFDMSLEINHANLIKALLGLNNNKKALKHYDYISNFFYDEYGIKPSSIITDLYKDITDKKSGYEKNIVSMKNDLREVSKAAGTMRCNYETFKAIYRLNARAAYRNGKSVFIVLLTVKPKVSDVYFENNIEGILENLLDIVCGYLRKDDVIARCGRIQYALMLSNIAYENTVMILDRLNNAISNSSVSRYIEVQAQVETLDPIELEG